MAKLWPQLYVDTRYFYPTKVCRTVLNLGMKQYRHQFVCCPPLEAWVGACLPQSLKGNYLPLAQPIATSQSPHDMTSGCNTSLWFASLAVFKSLLAILAGSSKDYGTLGSTLANEVIGCLSSLEIELYG